MLTETNLDQISQALSARAKTLRIVAVPAYSASATIIASANPDRLSFEVINIGTGLAHFGFATSLTPGNGWPLAASDTPGEAGGGYVDAAPHNGIYYAVSAIGTTLCIVEG